MIHSHYELYLGFGLSQVDETTIDVNCLSYTVNTITADAVVTLGVRASAAVMLFTLKAGIFHLQHQISLATQGGHWCLAKESWCLWNNNVYHPGGQFWDFYLGALPIFTSSLCNSFEDGHPFIMPPVSSWKGVYWFHLVRPSVRLWAQTCPLCIFNNTHQIHFIFAHLIKQLQKVCHV